MQNNNKRKIINDPVWGFINIPSEIIFDLIGHPYFQRLRRIKQLGLTNLVYPGANHTRFQHSIGAMHLVMLAIQVITAKGHIISDEEAEAVTIAILLHDIGHGPYSHALEYSIVKNVIHEDISLALMYRLNEFFDGKLDLAIKIFKNEYSKLFLHQLIASQLDMDRLDYLRRDSFFTGVTEGVVGSDRIIKMLNVVDDQLVIEHKGIYSIEKFLIARRLMYWQVYLHKTVISAENILVKTLKRAKELADNNVKLFATPALHYFLYNHISKADFLFDSKNRDTTFQYFTSLDDSDIIVSIKEWQTHDDKVLSYLASCFTNRILFKTELQNEAFSKDYQANITNKVKQQMKLSDKEMQYIVFTGKIKNNVYSPLYEEINILYKSGEIVDIADASDMLNISSLSKTVTKHFLCFPKMIEN